MFSAIIYRFSCIFTAVYMQMYFLLHINAPLNEESCPQFFSAKQHKSISPRLIRLHNNG